MIPFGPKMAKKSSLFPNANSSKGTTNPEIYVMNADGTSQIRLTVETTQSRTDIGPCWSPDRTQIAWIKSKNGLGDVWLMNSDGSNQHKISNFSWPNMSRVSWSPTRNILLQDMDDDGDGAQEILSLPLDGTNGFVIYDPGNDSASLGDWSPDGKWIAFTQIDHTTGNSSIGAIQYTLDGTGKIMFLPPGTYSRPSWSSLDVVPPVSQFVTLPAFSPAGGFDVEWQGFDAGPAPLSTFQYKVRNGATGPWLGNDEDYFPTTGDYKLRWNGSAGQTIYFRSRACDEAWNCEAWPEGATFDTFTTLYSYELSGTITDNRGFPLPNVPVTVDPAPLNDPFTDIAGSYDSWFASEMTHTMEFEQPGYGSFPPYLPELYNDLIFDLYLPPSENLLLNNSFESGLDNWVTSGDLDVTQINSWHHSGTHAVSLGLNCNEPCLGDQDNLPGIGDNYEIAIDPLGVIHLLRFAYNGEVRIEYLYHTPGGSWSVPVTLASTQGYDGGPRPQLAVGPDGTVHLAWNTYQVHYKYKPLGGDWSATEDIADGTDANIAVDHLGNIYVVYRSDFSTIYYTSKTPAGTWNTPVQLNTVSASDFIEIAAGLDNTIHFLWQQIEGMYYRSRLPDGSLTEEEHIFHNWGRSGSFSLIVDQQGQLHAYWAWPYAAYYANRPAGGIWSTPFLLNIAQNDGALTVDSSGKVHLIANGYVNGNEPQRNYRTRSPNGSWSFPKVINEYVPPIYIDSQDRLYLFKSVENPNIEPQAIFTSKLAENPQPAYLSQVVTIPGSLHHPTLTGMYRFTDLSLPATSHFTVNITEQMTSTRVFSTSEPTDWKLLSIDMQDWVGQTVTITFGLHQSAGEKYAQLVLDDLSLGAWETPLITSVSPTRIGDYQNATIVISGTNFIETPSVYIGDVLSPSVEWLDEHTLKAKIPPALKAGLYSIQVINPAGQTAILADILKLGYQVYLPATLKTTVQ